MKHVTRILAVAFMLSLATYSHAQQSATPDVPHILSYQGLLSTPSGQRFDGLQYMTVRLYGDADGHQLVWEDTFSTTVSAGVFNLMLGSQKPLPDAPQMGMPLWIAVRIGDGDELKPTPLSATPYALAVANNSITAEKLATDYVGSISVNDQKISGKGTDINLKAGPGLSLTYDPITNAILLNTASVTTGKGKGATPQTSYNYIMNQTSVETGASFNIDGSGVIGTTLEVDSTTALHGAVTLGTATGSTAGKLILNDATSSTSKAATITGASQYSDNRTYTVTDVGANADFVMTKGNQTINGTKELSKVIIDSGTASLSTLSVSGLATFGSKVTVADTLTLPTLVTTHAIVPSEDTTISLGNPQHKFRDLYLGPHSLVMGSGTDQTQFSVGTGGLVITQSSSTSTDSTVLSASGTMTTNTVTTSGPITSGDSIQAAGTITSGNSIIIHGNAIPRAIEGDLTMKIFTTDGDILMMPASNMGVGYDYPYHPQYLLDVNGTFHTVGAATLSGNTSIDAAPSAGGTITIGNASSTTNIIGNVTFSSAPQLPLPQNNLYVGGATGEATAYAPSTNSVLITDALNGGTPHWATTLPSNLTINSATVSSATISGGSISGTPISGSTGSFTTLSSSSTATLASLSVTGGSTMASALNMSGNAIHNVATPTTSTDADTKGYADALAASQTSALNAEITRAESAEGTLTTNLNQEISDRQAAVTAEASARTAADATLTANLSNEITNRQNAVSTEASARSAADATLTTNLNNEIARAETAEDTLTVHLSSEVSARQAAISAEASTRSSADATLTTNLNNETAARQAADAAETAARAAADATLTTNLNNETSARQAADAAESAARTAADASITANLNNEIAARTAGDATLTTNLNNETTARQAGDATLTTNLNNEISRAQAAEATKLALAGGTMTGAINMGSNAITNMADPTNAQDAATKNYVDNLASGTNFIQNGTSQQASANFNISGTGTMTGLQVNGASAASASLSSDAFQITNNGSGNGLHAASTGAGDAIYAIAWGTGRGIYANAQGANQALFATSQGADGINGITSNASSYGVHGYNNAGGTGVHGNSQGSGNGVMGENNSTGAGVLALNTGSGVGLSATSTGTGDAIDANATGGGNAITAHGRVQVDQVVKIGTQTADPASPSAGTKLRLTANSGNFDTYDYGVVDNGNLGYIESNYDQYGIFLDDDNNNSGAVAFTINHGASHTGSPAQMLSINAGGNLTIAGSENAGGNITSNGSVTASGNVNATGGSIQTNGTTRIDHNGNATVSAVTNATIVDVSTNYTVQPNDYIIIESNTPRTISLPASPTNGRIVIVKYASSSGTCTLSGNGNLIVQGGSASSSLTLGTGATSTPSGYTVVWSTSEGLWLVIGECH